MIGFLLSTITPLDVPYLVKIHLVTNTLMVKHGIQRVKTVGAQMELSPVYLFGVRLFHVLMGIFRPDSVVQFVQQH